MHMRNCLVTDKKNRPADCCKLISLNMDAFEDNSDEDDFRSISETTFRKMQEKLTKLGYADGVSQGEADGRQIGFDAGFADGLLTGFEIGKYACLFKMLKEYSDDSTSEKLKTLQTEQSNYESLNIEETESKVHCKYLQHKDETETKVISQHQQKYIKDLNDIFIQKLPVSSAFLNKSCDDNTNDKINLST